MSKFTSPEAIRQRLADQGCPAEAIEQVLRAEAAVDATLDVDDDRVERWEREARRIGGGWPIRLYYGPPRTMKEIPAGSEAIPYRSRVIVYRGREYTLNPRFNG